MKVMVTDAISRLSGKVSGFATDAKEKATAIWEHVREIPYNVFSVTPERVEDLVDKSVLTCYGKAFLQAALLESEHIPWRFEYSMCPSTAIEDTVKAMEEQSPLLSKIYDTFPSVFKGKSLLHTAVQVNVDGDWKRMDSTIPKNVCDKIADPAKREKCQSFDNVTAVHECEVVGHGTEMPRKTVKSMNVLSRLGGWVNNAIKNHVARPDFL